MIRRIGAALAQLPGPVLVTGHSGQRPHQVAELPLQLAPVPGAGGGVAARLVEVTGEPGRFTAEGRADTEPRVPDNPRDARNRRVEITLAPARAGGHDQGPEGVHHEATVRLPGCALVPDPGRHRRPGRPGVVRRTPVRLRRHASPWPPEARRWWVIGTLFAVWALWQIVSAIVARMRNRRLMEQLAAGPEPAPDPARVASAEELETLRRRFDEALAVLKGSEGRTGLGGHWVYQLPWYLIIGPPGCGKTTALVNSGLRFPLAEQLGQDAIHGVGGTRNCDWWFTDEAVLLDTAGRYTTQDSYAEVDSAAWSGFLGLLKKHRPRRPINGVLVAVSLSDLLQQSQAERDAHARAIRGRVQEIYSTFQIRCPDLCPLHEGGPGGRLHRVLRRPGQGGAGAGLGHDLPLRR